MKQLIYAGTEYLYLRYIVLLLLVVLAFNQILAAYLSITLAVFGLFVVFKNRKNKKVSILPTALQYGLWLLFLVAYLSIRNSADTNASTYNFIYVVGQYIVAIWVLLNCGNYFVDEGIKTNLLQTYGKGSLVRKFCEKPFVVQGLLALGLAGVAVVIYGLLQQFLQVKPTDIWIDPDANPFLKTRVFSTWENPNILAGYLCFLGAYLMSFLSVSSNKNKKLALLIYLLLTTVCLVYTFSRGFWIAMTLQVFVFIACFHKNAWKQVLGLAVVGGLIAGPIVWQRVASIFNGTDTSADLRIAYWDIALTIIKEHPLGVGWYNYMAVFPTYDYYLNNAKVVMYHCHNLLLNITAEMGIQGLIVFLFVWIYFIYLAWTLNKKARFAWVQGVARGYLLMTVGILVGGLTDYVLFNVRLGTIFWALSIFVVLARQYNDYASEGLEDEIVL